MTRMTHWTQCIHDIAALAANPTTSSWLQEPGSITARLRRYWPDLKVDVLDEGVRVPTRNERARLGLWTGSGCWVREVRLHDGEQQLVHARTVIPAWGDSNPWTAIGHLGCKPLGELLFSLTDLKRSPLEFAMSAIGGDDCLRRTLAVPSRRCVFEREGALLLLTEAFECLVPQHQTPLPVTSPLA